MVRLERVLRLGVRLLPADRVDYGRALLAELPTIPGDIRSRGVRDGLRFVLREVLLRPAAAAYGFGVAAATSALVVVDQSPSDVANQASLGVLVIAAFVLGGSAPRWAWLSGLALGVSLAAAHAVYQIADIPLGYTMEPGGWAGPVTLLVLVVPAVLAALAGAAVRTVGRQRNVA
jgi:hypothetical protein